MKKMLIMCVSFLLVGGIAFSQSQDPGYSNTVYTGFGSGGMLDFNQPVKGSEEIKFDGFVDYFSANFHISGVTIAGDIAWQLFEEGNLTANILGWNFNAVMTPFKNFDIGVGTSLEWEVGPKPFSGPAYSAYAVPEYAGLSSFTNSVSAVQNSFADKSVAVRYSLEDVLMIGAGLNGDAGEIGAGLGVRVNVLHSFYLGFAYNGAFKSTGNNFYLGSSIYAINDVDIDVWANFIPDYAATFGGRISFHKNSFRFTPEFSATFWDDTAKSPSWYAALITEMSLSSTVLAGINASLAMGSDPNVEWDGNESGARLNITPHIVWNITKSHRISIGANIIPIWWQDGTTDFYWSLPVSWKVLF